MVGRRDLTAFDDRFGRQLEAHRDAEPLVRSLFVVVTQFGSMPWIRTTSRASPVGGTVSSAE